MLLALFLIIVVSCMFFSVDLFPGKLQTKTFWHIRLFAAMIASGLVGVKGGFWCFILFGAAALAYYLGRLLRGRFVQEVEIQ